ncbi:isopeptide-forming domain-containing fimbrial protein, partial [Bacillus paramycoides]|uniref:isopeptide-forming domain-containing fimbrial protein n=1 Tax=Bacillus paramycoides TaxID=2026194 RepID=UPI003D02C1CC
LEVKGAKLLDSEGKEVKTGKMDIKGNKVEFVFDKKDNSYLYLAGQTYTLKIDAKIKDGVKAEELAKYLVKDGVPNTGQLNIGGNKPLVSNEVYVVPPTEKQPEPVKPEEPKQPESKPEPQKVDQPKQKVLPQTNEETTFIPYVLAAVFILTGVGLYLINRKRRMNH